MEKRYQVFVSSTFSDLLVILEYVQRVGSRGTCSVSWNRLFEVVGRTCINLPSQEEVENAINGWLFKLIKSTGPGRESVQITHASFQAAKVQFYALGLIRMEMLMRPGDNYYAVDGSSGPTGPQPTLCWVLTDAGRAALADLLAEKRPLASMPKAAS